MPSIEEYKNLKIESLFNSCLWSKTVEREREYLKKSIGNFLARKEFSQNFHNDNELIELMNPLEDFEDILNESGISLIPSVYTNDLIRYRIV